jgi:hypothetical protein
LACAACLSDCDMSPSGRGDLLKRPIFFTKSGLHALTLFLLLTRFKSFECLHSSFQECGRSIHHRGNNVHLRDSASPAFQELASKIIDTRNQIAVITDNPWSIHDMPRKRKNELLKALHANLKAPHVAQVHLLGEVSSRGTLPLENLSRSSRKLFTYDLESRMTFYTAIEYANRCLPSGTTFVIANADIIFAHESTRLLPRFLQQSAVVALTRHNMNERGQGVLHSDPSASQDVWSMKTPFEAHEGLDIPLGYLGSDNRFAYLLNDMQVSLHNWCTDVVVWHHHLTNIRGEKERLPEPYKFLDVSRPRLSWFDFDVVSTPLEGLGSRPIDVLRFDLPRMANKEAWTSESKSLRFSPAWTEDALIVALARSEQQAPQRHKAFVGQVKGASRRSERSTSTGSPLRSFPTPSHFLDICWDAWMHESYEWKWIIFPPKIYSAVPSFRIDLTLVLVPFEVARFLCQTEWSSMLIGIHNSDGSFREFIDCEKRPSR